MLVSILVPSFNQGRFLRETLDSILAQDHEPLEVLVLDGASTDDTLDVLRSYGADRRLRWWSEADAGVVDAVNKGLARATGDVVGIQSSDDVYLPGAVKTAVAALEADPALDLVYGDVELIDAESRLIGRDVQPPFDLADYLGRLQYVPQPSAFFRARVLARVGGWRAEMNYAADADFWLRIATSGGSVRKIDRLLARYRYHEGQRDTQKASIARDWTKAVGELLRRGVLTHRQGRYARMGCCLARYRYAADGDWRGRTRALYAALIHNPGAIAHPGFPRRELLPGREPLWRALSRMKRSMGFAPLSDARTTGRGRVRALAGTLLLDHPRGLWRLWAPGALKRGGWTLCHNRGESIRRARLGRGVDCNWQFTSELTSCREMPGVGRRLMSAAMREWPPGREASVSGGVPDVSFIVGHRGAERSPHLLATLRSLVRQSVPSEIVVVEQAARSSIADPLPAGVRHVLATSGEKLAFSRSWLFNVGARHATGRILVLHDGDLLAPAGYARELVRLVDQGFDAARLCRFVFYLDTGSTARVIEDPRAVLGETPRAVVQNTVGGTVAVTRAGYEAIGGHDEAFLGWGGEDNEFFDRLSTLSCYRWGYLPFVHLEHPVQPGARRNADTAALMNSRMAIPATERAGRLRSLPWGSLAGPLAGSEATA